MDEIGRFYGKNFGKGEEKEARDGSQSPEFKKKGSIAAFMTCMVQLSSRRARHQAEMAIDDAVQGARGCRASAGARCSGRLASSAPSAAWHASYSARETLQSNCSVHSMCSSRLFISLTVRSPTRLHCLFEQTGSSRNLCDHHRRQEHALDVEARQAQRLAARAGR